MRGAFPALVFSGRRKSVVIPKKNTADPSRMDRLCPFRGGPEYSSWSVLLLNGIQDAMFLPAGFTSVPELVPLLRPALRVADMAPQAAPQARLCRKDIAAAPAGRGVALCQTSGACSKRTCPDQISAAFRIRRPRRVPAIRCWYFLRELQRPDGRTSCPSPRRASA